MLRRIPHVLGALFVVAVLGSGALAVLSKPAGAQTTTCYAIVCNGSGTCSVVQIECPKPIVPVKPTEKETTAPAV
jgi:hypothetical protein